MGTAGSIRQEIRRITRASAPFTCPVTMEAPVAISDGFVRIRLRSAELAAYQAPRPADAFKLLLPPEGADRVDFPERGADGIPFWPEGSRQPVLRAFTVRRVDPSRRWIDFDVARHGDGVVTRWLSGASPGDRLGLAGMRREFHAPDGVRSHLLVGDSSALPAIAAIVEALPEDVPASVYLAVGHESDRELVPSRDNVRVHWVADADAAPVGPGCPLVRAVREGSRPAGRVQAWLAAEAGVVRELRGLVLEEFGVAREDLHAAGYWKSGMDSTLVDEALLVRYQEELSAGADVTDPDVRERVEFA